MSCGVHRSIRYIFVPGYFNFLASNFAGSEVHLTAIQALSNHKKDYGGLLQIEWTVEAICRLKRVFSRK